MKDYDINFSFELILIPRLLYLFFFYINQFNISLEKTDIALLSFPLILS